MSTAGRARQGFEGLKLPGHWKAEPPTTQTHPVVEGRLANCLGALTFG